MLLFILLGVIAKLALVSAECHIGNINRNIDWTAFSGTWYWLYHNPQKYNEVLDCPVTKIEALNKKSGRITTYAYFKKTHSRHSFVGNFADWDNNSHPNVYYPEPSSDTNCGANETCTTNPGYASAWSGKYRVISSDHRRYTIFEYCCKNLNTICVYIAFRTLHPDEETLNVVKRVLKENGLDFNQLVRMDTNHC